MFYVVPGKEKKKRNSADCGDESQSAALRKPKIRKRRRGFFFFKKKEDARYVHIMLSSGICNFKAASTRESRVTIFKVITQMSYE